jgi:hypothetical protein
MSLFGNFMRGMEILGVAAYFGYTASVLHYFTIWVFLLSDDIDPNLPDCLNTFESF